MTIQPKLASDAFRRVREQQTFVEQFQRTPRREAALWPFCPPLLLAGERGQISVFRLPRSWFPSSFLAQPPQLSAVYHEPRGEVSTLLLSFISALKARPVDFQGCLKKVSRRTITPKQRERERERERERGFSWQQDNGQSKR